MNALTTPLTLETALASWRADPVTLVLIVLVLVGYGIVWRRSPLPAYRAVLFGVVGCGVWLVASCGFVGVYSDVLFWVRALQFVLILMVAPFGLALGMPLTALRDAVGATGRARFGTVARSRIAHLLASLATSSMALLAVPWLIYLSGWYRALLVSSVVDVLTRILLVAIGFGYFYARLQLDPVPHRYPQGVTLFASLAETLGDGVLGVILWQGPLIAADFYAALGRDWGPSIRTDQTVGAGVFWILGDVVGLPFLLVVFGRLRAQERVREEQVDAQIEQTPPGSAAAEADDLVRQGLWWQTDPQIRERFR